MKANIDVKDRREADAIKRGLEDASAQRQAAGNGGNTSTEDRSA